MPIIEPIPRSLEEKLGSTNGERLIAAVATDLSPAGLFGEEWLVLTTNRLRVYAGGNHDSAPRIDYTLEQLRSTNADGLVGGGALLTNVEGKTVELLRYSNAQQRKFGRIAKYLNDLERYRTALKKFEAGGKDKDGKPLELPKEPVELAADQEEQKRCPNCKLLLPEG